MGNKDKQQQNISSGISQIVLKNAATFDESGASFEDLNSINFIYGTNGSGKTTTSSFLKNQAENRFEDKFANSKIEWHNSEILKIVKFITSNLKKNNLETLKLKAFLRSVKKQTRI
ncbi:hypothetical protein JP0177_09870 [Helicobacter pylori]